MKRNPDKIPWNETLKTCTSVNLHFCVSVGAHSDNELVEEGRWKKKKKTKKKKRKKNKKRRKRRRKRRGRRRRRKTRRRRRRKPEEEGVAHFMKS